MKKLHPLYKNEGIEIHEEKTGTTLCWDARGQEYLVIDAEGFIRGFYKNGVHAIKRFNVQVKMDEGNRMR